MGSHGIIVGWNYFTSMFFQGHSTIRKLKSDGKVDTLQALHNLNEGVDIFLFV